MSMAYKVQTFLRLIILSLLLIACTSAPPTNFYVLEAQNVAGDVDGEKVNPRIIGIGPLSLPALLERKQIVTRSSENAIRIAEFHQWAAPLHDNMIEVISLNLSRMQSRHVIRTYPWSAYGAINYRVIIDIDRFDSQPGGAIVLEARWAIMNEKDHVVFANHHSRIEHQLKDTSYAASVKALSGLLFEFSQQISGALDHLND
jgi:uncharacterized lipoprotein YmbA